MPYHIEHSGSKYNVVLDTTGKVVGSHPTKEKAKAHLAALYANVKDVKKESAGAGRISGPAGQAHRGRMADRPRHPSLHSASGSTLPP